MARVDRIEQRGEAESPSPVLDVPRDEFFEEEQKQLLEAIVFRVPRNSFPYEAGEILWRRKERRGEAALAHGDLFYSAGRDDLAAELFEIAEHCFKLDQHRFGLAAAKSRRAWKEYFGGDKSRATETVQEGLADLGRACRWGLPTEGGRWTMPEAKKILIELKIATDDGGVIELAEEFVNALDDYTDYVGQSGEFLSRLESIEQRLEVYAETGQVSLST